MGFHNAQIIETKLCLPRMSKNVIRRKNVEGKLKLLAGYKLAIVTAPAGYGKTTAVADFLVKEAMEYAWFSIDDADNDPVRFWRYLTASVASCLKQEELSKISINQELVSSNITTELLIDELCKVTDHIVLVLDDYHLIHNEIILKSVAYFIKYMPPCLSMVILSRKEDNELSMLRSRETAISLGIRELSFDFDETAELFMQRGIKLNSEAISVLGQCTEGWAAGLVAASFSINESVSISAAVEAFSGKDRNIDRILDNEVFEHWPQEVKSFLLYTSFLDKLSGPLCGKVTGNEKCSELLKILAENNSFVISMDQENRWYRYHHLFQTFLLGRLEAEPASIQRSLYSLAGQWYQENDLIQDAIGCFIKAEEYEKAFILIRRVYLTMVQNGELTLWRKWMEKIPEELRESDVRTCAGLSWIFTMQNQAEKAEIWADKAQSCFDRIKDGLDKKEKDYLKVHIAVTYMNSSIFRMDIDKVLHYYKQIREEEIYTPLIIGEMNPGEPNLLNTAYGFKGRLNKIFIGYSDMLNELSKLIGDYTSYILIALAEAHYERGNRRTVYEMLVKNMGQITGLKNPGIIVPCFIALAKEKKARGDLDGAFAIIESGKKLLSENSRSVWNYLFDIFSASLYIEKGDVEGASQYIETDRLRIFDTLSTSREAEYIVFARYLMLTKKTDESLILLNRLDDFAEKENRLFSRIEILCLLAINYSMQEDHMNSMFSLHRALELGVPEGYVRTFVDELEPMVEVLKKYRSMTKLTENTEYAPYAKNLLKLTREAVKLQRAVKSPSDISTQGAKTSGITFSDRELEVLRHFVDELTNQEMAELLCITVRTVKFHNAHIYKKLGVKNRSEAVIKARKIGLFE
jgi:LuxR family transcriptional regulator, maltose regulon positive regulatory protein